MRPKVLIWVQHLLGIGHLMRAATLARACRDGGLDVTLVSGGGASPGLELTGIDFVQLPPIRAADRGFQVLVDDTDTVIDDAFKARRRDRLLEIYARVRPAIVITELFPFGRRQLRFEAMALVQAAAASVPRPKIVCSVRDILVQSPKPERVAEMLDLVARYYDLVLVHGDPLLVPLERTFAPAQRIRHLVRYTGYVVDHAAARRLAGGPGTGEVIVSAGGGAVGEPLLRAAIAARRETRLGAAPWRVLVGYALPEPAFRSIRQAAPGGVIVERARPDFLSLLCNCTLSISQGGYNTVMEVLRAGARGVIVPYAGGLETEQTLRARLLAGRGSLQVVAEHAVSAQTIARAAEAALDGPPPSAAGIDTSGAETSAGLIAALARASVA